MDNLLRERNRWELGDLLCGLEFQHLLHQAKRSEAALTQFAEWSEVMTLMQAKESSTDCKAQAFSSILRMYQAGNDPRWRAVLLAVYRLTLVAIHMRKIGWDNNPDDLWQNIVTIFFDAAGDCRSDDARVLQNLYSEILKRLRCQYRRQWRYERRHLLKSPRAMQAQVGGALCDCLAAVECCDTLRFWKQRLKRWKRNGLISRRQAALLFFTRVLGARLADYCRHFRLNYELTRKQRQRVEAALRRHGLSVQ